MKRREVIKLIGGAAASWPLAVRAQQHDKVRRIGVVVNVAADDPEAQASVAAFKQTLQQLGWSERTQSADRLSRGSWRPGRCTQLCAIGQTKG
jgi:hypothetical protein